MNINMVAVGKDPNGEWYMNVHTDEHPNIIMAEIACEGNSHFHYGENDDGFVRFGVSYDIPTMGHDPGYMWSSRCGVFNTMFGKKLIDIILCVDGCRYGCYYMTVDKAIELLPDDYHISLFATDDGEEHYHIIKNGEPDEYWGSEFICLMLIAG